MGHTNVSEDGWLFALVNKEYGGLPGYQVWTESQVLVEPG